ncbi:MAG: hypothetical protein LBJ62_06605 [Bifidobacteriaceae bacterium]|jgi:hypothetical protein|nr:hypothetical protein [Bifidobacteriaceae bacterium]
MAQLGAEPLEAALIGARANLLSAATELRSAVALVCLADPDGWTSPAADMYEIWAEQTSQQVRANAARVDAVAEEAEACRGAVLNLLAQP